MTEHLEPRFHLYAPPPTGPLDLPTDSGIDGQAMHITGPTSDTYNGPTNDSNRNEIEDGLESSLLDTFAPVIASPGEDNTVPISVTEFLRRSSLYDAQSPDGSSNPVKREVLATPSVAALQQIVDSHLYSVRRSDADYQNSFPRANLGVHDVEEPDKQTLWNNARFYARATHPLGYPSGVYVLQYYWLYIENATGAPLGDHDGDIACVDLTVDARPAVPRVVDAILHNHGRQLFVQPAALRFSSSTHPIVFTEEGTNEPWPNPGIGGTDGWPTQGVTSNKVHGDDAFDNEDEIDHDHWGYGPWRTLSVVNLGNLTPGSLPEYAPTYYPFTAQPGLAQSEARLFATFPGSWGNTHKIYDNTFTDTTIESPRGPYFNGGGKMWDRGYSFGLENAHGAGGYQPVAPPAPTAPAVDAKRTPVDAAGTVTIDRFTVTGYAEPGGHVEIFADGGPSPIGIGTATRGAYSVPVGPLSDGVHTLTARVISAWDGSLRSDTSPALTVSVANDELQVSQTAVGSQNNPAVATNARGDRVVVWRGPDRNDPGQFAVYARVYNPAGLPAGGEFAVGGRDGTEDGTPAVAMDAAGNFVVAWQSSDGRDSGILARRFAAGGTPLADGFVVAGGAGDRLFARVAMAPDGRFVVAWDGQDGGGRGVFARWYDAAGAAVTAEVRLSAATAGDQRNPVVAMDGAANTTAAWSGPLAAEDGGGYGLYARRFTAAGVPRDAADRLVDASHSPAPARQAAAADALGNVVLAWAAPDGDGYGVYMERFSSDGQPFGGKAIVNGGMTAGDQSYPAVALSGAGDIAVAWHSNGSRADDQAYGVFLQLYTADGSPAAPAVHVNRYTSDDQSVPSIGFVGGGSDVFAAWQSYGQDGSEYTIRARQVSSLVAGGELSIAGQTSGSQNNPAVATNARGDRVVVWRGPDRNDPGQFAVYARVYNPAGLPAGGEFAVGGRDGTEDGTPAVAMDAAGNFVVAWQSSDGRDSGILARRFAAGGTPLADGFVVAGGAGDRLFARVAMAPDGRFVVAWDGQDGGGRGVFARWYDAAGAAVTAEVRLSAATAGDQRNPVVAMDGAANTTAAWSGPLAAEDGGGYGLYARRFTAAGVPRDAADRLVDASHSPAPARQAAAADALGNVVLAWAAPDGDGYGVYSARFGQDGQSRGARMLANLGATKGDQFYAAVAVSATGEYAVAWHSNTARADEQAYGVFAQVYAADGSPGGAPIHLNRYITDDQTVPSLGFVVGGTDLFAAWQSYGEDGSDYAVVARQFAGAVLATLKVQAQVSDGVVVQRSFVRSLTVTFNKVAVFDAGAFLLSSTSGAASGITLSPSNPSGDGRTWVLSFAGTGLVGGSLPDGVYRLTIVGARVHAGASAGPVMAADSTLSFHRLFGDQDGNKTVNNADYVRFRAAFGASLGAAAYSALFDFDGNGVINNADYLQFRGRFGTALTYF